MMKRERKKSAVKLPDSRVVDGDVTDAAVQTGVDADRVAEHHSIARAYAAEEERAVSADLALAAAAVRRRHMLRLVDVQTDPVDTRTRV